MGQNCKHAVNHSLRLLFYHNLHACTHLDSRRSFNESEDLFPIRCNDGS
jgi:hypothetical protein